MQWGRINRASYFLAFIVIVVGYGLMMKLLPRPPHIAELLLALIAIPRLHDIGRKARWWVIGAVAAEIVLVFGTLYFLPLRTVLAIAGGYALLVLAAMILLGARKGDGGANAFGDAPPPGLSFRILTRKPGP